MNPSDFSSPCRWALIKLGGWLGEGESTGAAGTVKGHKVDTLTHLPAARHPITDMGKQTCTGDPSVMAHQPVPLLAPQHPQTPAAQC